MDQILYFGSYLEELLTIKNIDKKHFASTININRSQLYRFLNSEQLPDREQLQEIIEKLNLRATEEKKLLDSYECTEYGWEIVKGRKLITEMLQKLDHQDYQESLTYDFTLKNKMLLAHKESIVPVQGKTKVKNTLFSILEMIKEKSQSTSVNIILQPDMPDFINFLAKILTDIFDNNKDISIRHIVRFKNTLLKKNKLHNLVILDYLIPLSFFESIYKVYYSTENLTTEGYDTFFPNFISINSETAFAFTQDYENGILYTSFASETIKLLNEEFDKICSDCLPLFFNLENYEKQSLYIYQYEYMVQADTILLKPENSWYAIPADLLKKKEIEQTLPKAHAQTYIKRIENFQERLTRNKALEIISPKGLEHFAATGQLLIYSIVTFNKKERVSILSNLLKLVKENKNYTLYIMKENNPFYQLDFAVYTIGSELLYFIPSYTGFNLTDNIIIRNKGIIESFNDYLHTGFTEKNCIVDRNKVASVIENVINSI
jgi:transcriptional regulator with XRE-family HTH domain